MIPLALDKCGSFKNRIIIDTTNQFGTGPLPAKNQTAAKFNSIRMKNARYTKSFNTLTAGFQASSAGRKGENRVVQWLCGDDTEAKKIVSKLIDDAGFQPVDLGNISDCWVMEAPRRKGAVYGEEYRINDANEVVIAIRMGLPIPPTPIYKS